MIPKLKNVKAIEGDGERKLVLFRIDSDREAIEKYSKEKGY